MSNELLCVGTIIEFSDKSPFWRGIVRQVYAEDVLVADVTSAVTEKISIQIMLQRIESCTAKFLSYTSDFNDITFTDLTLLEQTEVCRRLRYIEYLVEQGFRKVTGKSVESIKKYAELLGEPAPHWQSVRNWFCSYYGEKVLLKNLFPRHRFKGSREPKISNEIINIIKIEARRYFKQSRPSLSSIYENVRAKVVAHNLRNPSSLLKVPVYNTVKARIKNVTFEQTKKSREGKRALRNSLAGTKGVTTTRIHERAEIDHTQLDIYVLHDHMNDVIGRPTLTPYLDHYSKSILGYLLSFEPGSFAGVCAASRNAFLPKNAREKYGTASDWPMHGIPELIVTDNANEFWGKNFTAVADEINSDLQYCPIRTPNYKGSVERIFMTIKTQVLDDLPGVVRKPDEHGEDYNARREAKLTFSEFQAYLTKWIVMFIIILRFQKIRELHINVGSKAKRNFRYPWKKRWTFYPKSWQQILK